MAEGDGARWDARYAAAPTGAPVPPDAAREVLAWLPRTGCALDVAAGRGQVAVWLALRGLAVDAVDASAAGLAGAVGLARAHGVEERVRTVHHDLDAGLPAACTGPYDVVVCQRFRDPALYPALVGRLTPGGLLVVTVLSEVGARAGPFRAPAGELRAAFGDLEVVTHAEGDGEARLVARRAG